MAKRDTFILVLLAAIISVEIFYIILRQSENDLPVLSIVLGDTYYFELSPDRNLRVARGFPDEYARRFFRQADEQEEAKLTGEQYENTIILAEKIKETIAPGSDYRLWGTYTADINITNADIIYKGDWYAITYDFPDSLKESTDNSVKMQLQKAYIICELVDLLIEYSPMPIEGVHVN